MTVNQNGRPWEKAGVHAHSVVGRDSDGYKTFPSASLTVQLRSQLAKEASLEFLDLLHVHAHYQRLGGGDGAFDHKNVFESILARWGDAGALVDFGGVEQIED